GTATRRAVLAGIGNRGSRKPNRPRRFWNCNMFSMACCSGRGGPEAAILARRDPCGRLEGAVERPERLEAGVHRDGDDGNLGLGGIGERGFRLLDPMVVEEGIEIAVAESLVDEASQPVLGNAELGRQGPDREIFAT